MQLRSFLESSALSPDKPGDTTVVGCVRAAGQSTWGFMTNTSLMKKRPEITDISLLLAPQHQQTESEMSWTINDTRNFPVTLQQRRRNLTTLRSLEDFFESHRFKTMSDNPNAFKFAQTGMSDASALQMLMNPRMTIQAENQETLQFNYSAKESYRRKYPKFARATTEANSTIESQIAKADELKQIAESQSYHIPNVNVKEVFRNADTSFNQMQMILKRLIPENDSHSRITERNPAFVYVIPENMMTFKIPCRKLPSPCRITIRYLDPQIRGITPDLTVWVSTTEEVPQDKKCEQKLVGPTRIMVVEKQKKKTVFVSCQTINMSFLSKAGVNIKVQVKFIDVNEFRKRVQKSQGAPHTLMTREQEKEVERHSKELMAGYLKHRPKWKVDFTKQNIINLSAQKPKQLPSLSGSCTERATSVEQRRNSQLLQRKKERVARMLKWDVWRKKRHELLGIQNQTRDRISRVNRFLRMALFFLNLKKLKSHCESRIFAYRWRLEVVRRLDVCKEKVREHMRRFRQTAQERLLLTCRQSISAVGTTVCDRISGQTRALFVRFLEKTSMVGEIIFKFGQLTSRLHMIRDGYLEHKRSMKQRSETLTHHIWIHETVKLQEYFSQKKGAEAKKLVKRLQSIDYRIKHRVCELYMLRQNLMHNCRFLKWLTVYREDKYSKAELKLLKKGLSTRLQQLYEIDTVLFFSVDIPPIQDICDKPAVNTDLAATAKKLTPAEWKSEERIANLMHYPAGHSLMKKLKKQRQKRVQLTTAKITYTVCLGEHVPLIQIVPAGYEIYHRLILRAALSEGLFEFNLSKLPNL